MESLWTWGGRYFGYRDGDDLWTHNGKHVGKLFDDEVYGPDGRYLGELRDGKLISNTSKTSRSKPRFTPLSRKTGLVKLADYTGFVMISGHEDFPNLEE